MDPEHPLYLSSLESYRFKSVRECRLVRFLTFTTGKECALVTLTPGIVGQEFGVADDIVQFIIASRHEDASLSSIDEFPCIVHIGLPSMDWNMSDDVIAASDVAVVAWGELYRKAHDAAANTFD